MKERKFKFVKDYKQPEGTIKKGGEITIWGERVFFNDVPIDPRYINMVLDLVEYETKEGFNILKEIPLPLSARQPIRQGV